MSLSRAPSGVSFESVSLLSSCDRNDANPRGTESDGDSMSGVSVGTGVGDDIDGVGDDIDGVAGAVTTRRRRGMCVV